MDPEQRFDNLFVFEMANNHQGQVEHGNKIIDAMADICKSRHCRAAIKFQYRQLDTLIHPAFREAKEPKHIQRFLGTRLSKEEFKTLVDHVKNQDMMAMCTPFDEESVDVIEEHEIDIIKIASCSATDWPLLERVAKAGKPVICSTAGCSISDVDKVVSFFKHRNITLAIMHCVALYPTESKDLRLNQIDVFRERYPFLQVGFSTHERPENLCPVKIAVAKGATILERHVGVETDQIKLNKYSSTPEQAAAWVDAALEAKIICGSEEPRVPLPSEIDSLNSLKRGVYAKEDIRKGEIVRPDRVFYAMPLQTGQMTSGEMRIEFEAGRNYKKNEPLSATEESPFDVHRMIYSVIHEAKGMLYQARIAIGKEFRVHLSSHHGLENFRKTGAIIIECINREYCKKLIIQIPGQRHPTHHHKVKEETFQVLWGELKLTLDGEERYLSPGDQVVIKPDQKHSFSTEKGVIVEEVSTTHHAGDSYYDDPTICTEPSLRKTYLEHAQHTFEQYSFL